MLKYHIWLIGLETIPVLTLNQIEASTRFHCHRHPKIQLNSFNLEKIIRFEIFTRISYMINFNLLTIFVINGFLNQFFINFSKCSNQFFYHFIYDCFEFQLFPFLFTKKNRINDSKYSNKGYKMKKNTFFTAKNLIKKFLFSTIFH